MNSISCWWRYRTGSCPQKKWFHTLKSLIWQLQFPPFFLTCSVKTCCKEKYFSPWLPFVSKFSCVINNNIRHQERTARYTHYNGSKWKATSNIDLGLAVIYGNYYLSKLSGYFTTGPIVTSYVYEISMRLSTWIPHAVRNPSSKKFQSNLSLSARRIFTAQKQK